MKQFPFTNCRKTLFYMDHISEGNLLFENYGMWPKKFTTSYEPLTRHDECLSFRCMDVRQCSFAHEGPLCDGQVIYKGSVEDCSIMGDCRPIYACEAHNNIEISDYIVTSMEIRYNCIVGLHGVEASYE